MARYINANLLLKDFEDDCKNGNQLTYSDTVECILRQPTADVQPVVHGEWLNFMGDFSTAECSKCGEVYEVTPDEKPSEEFFKAFNECYKFCPRCGAKMGGNDDTR